MLTLAQTDGMSWFGWFWMLLLLGLGAFMILLVLLQRGRGGGLVGALGGAGGQSAFGTRAGDVFTKITVVVATLWVATAGIGGIALRQAATAGSSSLPEGTTPSVLDAPAGLETADPIDIGALGGSDDDTAMPADDADATSDDSIPAPPALPAPDATESDAADTDAKPAAAEAEAETPAADGEGSSEEEPSEPSEPAAE